MSELDDKLHEILDYLGETYYPVHEYNDTHPEENERTRDDAIAAIKQAFIDAGYRQNYAAGYWSKQLEKERKLHAWRDDEQMMTGREWYDRFNTELPQDHDGYSDDGSEYWYWHDSVLNAAKRAAGIEDTDV